MDHLIKSIHPSIGEKNRQKESRINKWKQITFSMLSNLKLQISNHFHQASGIKDWEKTMVKHNFLLSKSIDDYLDEQEAIPTRRLLKSYALVAIQFSFALLCALMAFNGDETIVAVGSPYHVLGKQNARIMYLMNGCSFLFGAAVRLAFIYYERKRKCYYLSILKWISSESRGELEGRYYIKICKRMKLIGKYFTICLDIYSLGVLLALLLFSVIAYHFEHKLDDSLARLLVFSIVQSYLIWQMCLSSSCTLFIYYITCVYLEYRFDQLNNSINKESVRSLNHAMSLVRKHNQIYLIHASNHVFVRMLLFVVYYIFTPITNLLLIVAILPETENIDPLQVHIAQLITGSGAVVSMIFLFTFSYCSTALCKSAHHFYPKLNSFIASLSSDEHFQVTNPNSNKFKEKLKIILLIEKLSGPPITVYCYNLFPLNRYEFYLFFCNVCSNFLLFVNILVK